MTKTQLEALGFTVSRTFPLGTEMVAAKTDEIMIALNANGYEKIWGHEGSYKRYAFFYSDVEGQPLYGKSCVSVYADEDKYNTIVFLQDSNAQHALDILEKDGEDAVVAYLSQWDNGESDDVADQSFGRFDTVSKIGEYTLSYDLRHGYIGLHQIVEPETEEV